MSDPRSKGCTTIELRDVIEVVGGSPVLDLVKVNIEGGEFELLDRMYEVGLLAKTRTVLVQFHEFGPDAYRARRRIRRHLSERHRETWGYPWVWERWDLP